VQWVPERRLGVRPARARGVVDRQDRGAARVRAESASGGLGLRLPALGCPELDHVIAARPHGTAPFRSRDPWGARGRRTPSGRPSITRRESSGFARGTDSTPWRLGACSRGDARTRRTSSLLRTDRAPCQDSADSLASEPSRLGGDGGTTRARPAVRTHGPLLSSNSLRARSSAGERSPHTREVAGSKPAAPTTA
jgi:hypothetical protein